jgi:hypothetical protein
VCFCSSFAQTKAFLTALAKCAYFFSMTDLICGVHAWLMLYFSFFLWQLFAARREEGGRDFKAFLTGCRWVKQGVYSVAAWRPPAAAAARHPANPFNPANPTNPAYSSNPSNGHTKSLQGKAKSIFSKLRTPARKQPTLAAPPSPQETRNRQDVKKATTTQQVCSRPSLELLEFVHDTCFPSPPVARTPRGQHACHYEVSTARPCPRKRCDWYQTDRIEGLIPLLVMDRASTVLLFLVVILGAL